MSDPSSNAQTLNLDAVSRYLTEHLAGFEGPLSAEKFNVGQSNPTFRLRTPKRDYVLRRKPAGKLLKSAHAVEREFRVQSALAGSAVPVPTMHLLCEDTEVIGSVFYVMDMVDGRNFPLPTLPELTPKERRAVSDEITRVLANLHGVDLARVGLADYGPTGPYLERQILRWSKQYRATETTPCPEMDRLMDVMQNQRPDDDGQRSLVHGDYRIDNMIFDADGTSCRALLDWELSTTGHPYADLASVLMQWRMPADGVGRGLQGIDRAGQGLPSDADFVAEYATRRSLHSIENLGFFVAFCCFRMAAILQGVYRRALDGNASNPEFGLTQGAMVPIYATHGLDAFETFDGGFQV